MENGTKHKSIFDVTLADVARAYVGKPGCMCGCKGKYYTAVFEPEGFSDVNPRKVRIVLLTLQLAEANKAGSVDYQDMAGDGEGCYYAEIKGKNYAIYARTV